MPECGFYTAAEISLQFVIAMNEFNDNHREEKSVLGLNRSFCGEGKHISFAWELSSGTNVFCLSKKKY